MLILFASILAAIAFAVLFRLLWRSARPSPATGIVTMTALVLLSALGLLAATGRLHWLAALGAALLPFLRRGFGLLRYVPYLGQLYAAYRRQRNGGGAQGTGRPATGTMTRAQALGILGLAGNPSRQEIIDAHRRLMAKVHPDKGGSNYLAQQLNEAKQRLLSQG